MRKFRIPSCSDVRSIPNNHLFFRPLTKIDSSHPRLSYRIHAPLDEATYLLAKTCMLLDGPLMQIIRHVRREVDSHAPRRGAGCFVRAHHSNPRIFLSVLTNDHSAASALGAAPTSGVVDSTTGSAFSAAASVICAARIANSSPMLAVDGRFAGS